MYRFLILSFILLGATARGDTAVSIEVSNVSESDTQLIVTVFSGKKNWLKKPLMTEVLDLASENTNGSATFELSLAPGEYAFQVFHDLDSNGKMKTNFIGIPKEPVGVSNDAKGKFGPPKYKDAKLMIGDDALVIPIKLTKI